ncbi:carbohydrate ABC transporter permease [Schaalia naturae]|jgi:ABC-type sugar transport system permease subunit|uniref:Carbohydrate ABC transporter permease n=1 Tax=Schaalia naturae TaxID=635203 RepID=A0ABW2SPS7_9ACTO
MRKRSGGQKKSDGKAAMLFLAPLALIYGVYYIYSIVFLLHTSRTKVSISFLDPESVGFQNYLSLVQDSSFLRSVVNTLVFAACSIVAALTVGFFISAALATGFHAKRLLYVIFLVPTLMPSSLVATIFASMLQERFGILNETLRQVGLGAFAQPWLSDSNLAFGVVASIFCYLIGLPIMYFTADFSTLPTDSLEAALIDGAGTFRIMRSIIYPMMSATCKTIILSLLLGSFRALEVVWFSTQGGPGGSTEIVGSYLYDFATSSGPSIGFVSAAAIVVLLIAFVISTIQMLVSGRKDAS